MEMAEYDLVVRGGTVVDGNGGVPVTADVAVDEGVVREVGRVDGRGRREIDAAGAVVSPGFVDIHTHYDGQATWDSRLQPSSWNGITTVVMGNCGVGFAPVRREDRNRLIELMEGVEDIPGVAMQEGLTWDWLTFPDYLDALAGREYDIDLAAQVPHAALRVYAMGERAAAYAEATDEDIALMGKLARQAIEAGAVGFSTSRTIGHKSVAGDITPSYEAPSRELIGISRAIGKTGKGSLQLVTDFDDIDGDFGLMRSMVAASGRPLSLLLQHRGSEPEKYRKILDQISRANNDGFAIRGQAPVRAVGMLMGLECTLTPFSGNRVWMAEVNGLPAAEQAKRMLDPSVRGRILAAQTDAIPANIVGGKLIHLYDQMFEMTDPPNYEPSAGSSVASIARRERRTPEEIAYDILVKDSGRAMLYLTIWGLDNGSLDVIYDMLTHPHTIPGLSDGGAHVGTICDGSFATTLLQHWVRERDGKRLDLQFAVQRQSRDTARAFGFVDRGTLQPGMRADLNVIDLDNLRVHRPEMHFDLPAGGKRLLQPVDGYKHTFVRGVETYRDGMATGELPGRLIRQ
jgi:N-acyl-D-aspartate/D-glutamate deacylase